MRVQAEDHVIHSGEPTPRRSGVLDCAPVAAQGALRRTHWLAVSQARIRASWFPQKATRAVCGTLLTPVPDAAPSTASSRNHAELEHMRDVSSLTAGFRLTPCRGLP